MTTDLGTELRELAEKATQGIEVAHPGDARRQRRRGRPAMRVLVAVAIVLVVVALVARMFRDDGSVPVKVVDAPTVTSGPTEPDPGDALGDVYLAPGQVLLRTDPVVVLGAPAPVPHFDTTSLGTEIELEPLGETDIDTVVGWAEDGAHISSDGASSVLRIHAGGVIPDSQPAFIAYYDVDDPTFGQQRVVCQFFRTEGGLSSGSACGRYTPDEYVDFPGGLPTYDIPRPNYSLHQPGYIHFFPVADDVSVISLITADQTAWQRPVGGFAIFPADLEERETFEITTFDADGNTLVHEVFNDPADERRYPLVQPDPETTIQYPEVGPSDWN